MFEIVAGPPAQPKTPGVCYRHWRTGVFDRCSAIMDPDHERNRAWLGRIPIKIGDIVKPHSCSHFEHGRLT